jgi:hypothetical protein
MAPKRELRGRMLPVDVPEWEPLLNLAPDHIDDFMWMFSVELKDGTRLQAHKHCWTRGTAERPMDALRDAAPDFARAVGSRGERRGLRFKERIPFDDDDPTWSGERVLFFGVDLEEFMVIHAMKLRDRYRAAHEEARRWRR